MMNVNSGADDLMTHPSHTQPSTDQASNESEPLLTGRKGRNVAPPWWWNAWPSVPVRHFFAVITIVYLLYVFGKDTFKPVLENNDIDGWKNSFKNSGWLLMASFCLGGIFATKKSIPWFVFRLSHADTLCYHIWLNYLALLLLFYHMFGIFFLWYHKKKNLRDKLSKPQNYYAVLAAACFLLIIILSIPWIRRKKWKFFYRLHILLAPCFMYLSYLHIPYMMHYLLWTTIIMVLDVIVRIVTCKTADAVLEPSYGSTIIRVPFRMKHAPGQFANIRVEGLGTSRWHPLSFSSNPLEKTTFHVATLGPWSTALRALAVRQREAEVTISGPYGTLGDNIQNKKLILLAAGGVGVTPVISIFKALRHPHQTFAHHNPIVYLIWSSRSQEIFKSQLLPSEESVEQGVGNSENLMELVRTTQTAEAGTTSIYLHNTNPNTLAGDPMNDRPDWKFYLKQLAEQCPHSEVAVVACGPKAMIKGLKKDIKSHQGKVSLSTERFEF